MLSFDKILYVVTPYSQACAYYPLALAQWSGAKLYVTGRVEDEEPAKKVLQQADELGIESYPSTVKKLTLSALHEIIEETDIELLVIGSKLAGELGHLDKIKTSVWVLHHTKASHRNVMTLLPKRDVPDLVEKQILASLGLAGALKGELWLIQHWGPGHFLLGDSRGIRKELSSHLERQLDTLDQHLKDIVNKYSDERIDTDYLIVQGDLNPKIAFSVQSKQAHVLVLWQQSLKLAGVDLNMLFEQAQCSCLLLNQHTLS